MEEEGDDLVALIDWRLACEQGGSLRNARFRTTVLVYDSGYLLVARAFPQHNLFGLATGGGGVRLRNMDSHEVVANLQPAFQKYTRGIDMDDSIIAACSANPKPLIWDLRTHAHLMTLTGASGEVNWCQLEGGSLFGSSDDSNVHEWDPRKGGNSVNRFHYPISKGTCYSVQVRGHVIINTSGKCVVEWDRRHPARPLHSFATSGTARSVHFDDTHIAVSSLGNSIYLLKRDFTEVRFLFVASHRWFFVTNVAQEWHFDEQTSAHSVRMTDNAIVHSGSGILVFRDRLTGEVCVSTSCIRSVGISHWVKQTLRDPLQCPGSVYCVDVFDQGRGILSSSFDGNIRLHQRAPFAIDDETAEGIVA
jgi:hypothetical protein